FGLDIAFFYAGATHNTVANAELIGATTPFFVVPIGAKFFSEHLNPKALLFALVGFGGVAIVLFSASPSGDASLRGDIFGGVAVMMWVGYIATTRHFRREMDVVQYMAAMTPFAVVSVIPVALINGDITHVTAHGWLFIVLLTVITGVVAHGLMVFAQKTVPIGTIGIAQVAQPAFAALWSYILLDETLRGWQVVGMVLVLGGLVAFVALNRSTVETTTHGELVGSTG
ncbi:MAG TPA: DMT family transporter, partial [Ilumatobacteraceae bacterium]